MAGCDVIQRGRKVPICLWQVLMPQAFRVMWYAHILPVCRLCSALHAARCVAATCAAGCAGWLTAKRQRRSGGRVAQV